MNFLLKTSISIAIIFASFLSTSAFAVEYYCNGQYKKSGSTRYYPNGQYINSGSTRYHPSGQYANSGSTRYYPNGQYMNSGSTRYYPNGQYINSGSTRYYPNGQYINSGSSCYYSTGNSMGRCPDTITVTASSQGFEFDLEIRLPGHGEVLGSDIQVQYVADSLLTKYLFDYDSKEVSNTTAECYTDDRQIEKILQLYKSTTSENQSEVRNRICN